MDLHQSHYLQKKKVTSVEHQVFKNQIGKRHKNCQVCEFEGSHIVMKHTKYCETHCVCLCIIRHTPSHKLELNKIDDNPVTDFSWVCPNTNLACWEKLHTFYGPRGLFTNAGRIINTYAGCFRFGHQNLSCGLFLRRKAAFGKTDISRGKKKLNKEEDDGDNGGDNGNREEDDGNNGGGDGDEDAEQDHIGLDPVAKAVLEEGYRTMWL
jgi:hypothetical protein